MEKDLVNDVSSMHLALFIRKAWSLPDTDIRSYSPLTLAYIGDAVYDLLIRTYVVETGNAPANKLHRSTIKLVKASAQAEHFQRIEDMLTEEEIAVYKRGRNAKSFSVAKNASIQDYRIATGLEALIGYLYLNGRTERLIELIRPASSEV